MTHCHASLLPCLSAVLLLFCHDPLLPCFHVVLLPCCHAAMLPFCLASLLPCSPAALLPCCNNPLIPCSHAALLSCFHANLLPCFSAAMLPSCLTSLLPMPHPFHAAIQPGYYAAMFQYSSTLTIYLFPSLVTTDNSLPSDRIIYSLTEDNSGRLGVLLLFSS